MRCSKRRHCQHCTVKGSKHTDQILHGLYMETALHRSCAEIPAVHVHTYRSCQACIERSCHIQVSKMTYRISRKTTRVEIANWVKLHLQCHPIVTSVRRSFTPRRKQSFSIGLIICPGSILLTNCCSETTPHAQIVCRQLHNVTRLLCHSIGLVHAPACALH